MALRWPGGWACELASLGLDENFKEKYSLLPSYPGMELSEGVATKADTLAELARKTGIDAAAFEATVHVFNGFCETGVVPDFGREKTPWGRLMTGDSRMQFPNFGTLERGPFYAVQLVRVVMGVCSAGLRTDGRRR